jgi:hypothetical protein
MATKPKVKMLVIMKCMNYYITANRSCHRNTLAMEYVKIATLGIIVLTSK